MVRIVGLVFLLVASVAQGAIDARDFPSEEARARFDTLVEELRCPKCQNQNIAASNAPIALDMRDEVYRRILAGESDQEIVAALVERFGDFVRYRPALEPRTWPLWFGPAIAILVGLLVAVIIVRRARAAPDDEVLDDTAVRRAEALLKGDEPDGPAPNRNDGDRIE